MNKTDRIAQAKKVAKGARRDFIQFGYLEPNRLNALEELAFIILGLEEKIETMTRQSNQKGAIK